MKLIKNYRFVHYLFVFSHKVNKIRFSKSDFLKKICHFHFGNTWNELFFVAFLVSFECLACLVIAIPFLFLPLSSLLLAQFNITHLCLAICFFFFFIDFFSFLGKYAIFKIHHFRLAHCTNFQYLYFYSYSKYTFFYFQIDVLYDFLSFQFCVVSLQRPRRRLRPTQKSGTRCPCPWSWAWRFSTSSYRSSAISYLIGPEAQLL